MCISQIKHHNIFTANHHQHRRVWPNMAIHTRKNVPLGCRGQGICCRWHYGRYRPSWMSCSGVEVAEWYHTTTRRRTASCTVLPERYRLQPRESPLCWNKLEVKLFNIFVDRLQICSSRDQILVMLLITFGSLLVVSWGGCSALRHGLGFRLSSSFHHATFLRWFLFQSTASYLL